MRASASTWPRRKAIGSASVVKAKAASFAGERDARGLDGGGIAVKPKFTKPRDWYPIYATLPNPDFP